MAIIIHEQIYFAKNSNTLLMPYYSSTVIYFLLYTLAKGTWLESYELHIEDNFLCLKCILHIVLVYIYICIRVCVYVVSQAKVIYLLTICWILIAMQTNDQTMEGSAVTYWSILNLVFEVLLSFVYTYFQTSWLLLIRLQIFKTFQQFISVWIDFTISNTFKYWMRQILQ